MTNNFRKKQKYGQNTQFDSKTLNDFMKQDNSCIEMERTNQHLALHPFHLNELNSSIKEILNEGLPKYNKQLNGILFGYKNITLLEDVGAIFNDTCFIHLDIEADFFIFKPVVGKVLQGVVNKKSKDHLGCLVHKTFNISIPKPEDNDEKWIGRSIKIGSEITLNVVHTCFDGRLPYIRGEIVSVISEPEGAAEADEETSSKKIRENTIIKFDEESEEIEENEQPIKIKKKKSGSAVVDPLQVERRSSSTKKNLLFKFDEESEEIDENDKPPKKKKKIKSTSEVDQLQVAESSSPIKKKKSRNPEKFESEDVQIPIKTKRKRTKSLNENGTEEEESLKKRRKLTKS